MMPLGSLSSLRLFFIGIFYGAAAGRAEAGRAAPPLPAAAATAGLRHANNITKNEKLKIIKKKKKIKNYKIPKKKKRMKK
jgi:hypothetical protein